MKVKVGDNVKILAGKDKGKEGKVLRTLKKKDKVVVEGINIIKKHSKPNNQNDKGGIFAIHVSNVKVVEAKKEEKKEAKKAPKKEEVKETAKKPAAKKTASKKASK